MKRSCGNRIGVERIATSLICGLLMLTLSAIAATSDPMVTPAAPSAIASSSPMISVASVGRTLVAVGLRGMVLRSGDDGAEWMQAAVPVSVDLVAVYMLDEQTGWVVGHRGVVLHTQDGGRSWDLQLNGSQVRSLIDEAVKSSPDASTAQVEQAETWPFLDVWFESATEGYAVGAFNLAVKTEDGGKTWRLWSERIENPDGMHLYQLRGQGSQLLLAGEQGLIQLFDPATQRFKSLPSPYHGSLFGVVANSRYMVVYGMRGNAFVSRNAGRTWRPLETGVKAGLVDGVFLSNGRLLLVSQSGDVLMGSLDHGNALARVDIPPAPFTGIAEAGHGKVALSSLSGISVYALKGEDISVSTDNSKPLKR